MLLDKFKNTTPAPQPRCSSGLSLYRQIEQMQRRVRRQKLLIIVKSALISFVATSAIIFIAYCQIRYNRSFDHCEKLLAEIHVNLGILNTELADLKASMNAGGYHD